MNEIPLKLNDLLISIVFLNQNFPNPKIEFWIFLQFFNKVVQNLEIAQIYPELQVSPVYAKSGTKTFFTSRP